MSKHFNSGHVWGRVSKVTEDKADGTGTPYLSIELECPNEMFGNIKTYGRLWASKTDRSKVDAFLAFHKEHLGAAYHFQGFFSQYDKDEDKRYSNYTFFSWQEVTGKEFRAAFILTGEVTATETTADGDGKIYLHLVREGQGSHSDVEEDFEVYILNPQELAGIEDGALLQVKGVLRYKEAEDYFGGTAGGPLRPYVMEMKKEAF